MRKGYDVFLEMFGVIWECLDSNNKINYRKF
jgi:hypothetical protein